MIVRPYKGRRQLYLSDAPQHVLFTGESGSGKTTSMMRFIQIAIKQGWYVISLNDAKNLLEHLAVQLPEKYLGKYNTARMKYYNLTHNYIMVDIFHPLTTQLPDEPMPETFFKSMSLKRISDSEINYMLESEVKNTARELIKSIIRQMKPGHNIYDFFAMANKKLEREEIAKTASQKVKLPSIENFGLKGASMGDVKVADALLTAFSFQKQHPIFQPETSKYILDVKKDFFSRQTHLKIVVDHLIDDEKTKGLFKLYCVNEIIKHAKKAKGKRILLVFDELKDLCPDQASESSKILAKRLISGFNTHFRSKNIATVSSSQGLSILNKKLFSSNSFNVMFLGKNQSKEDIKIMQDYFKLNKFIIEKIKTLERYEFLTMGIEGVDIKLGRVQEIYPPTCCIKEPYFDMIRSYCEEFPQFTKNYKKELLPTLKELIKTQEEPMIKRAEEEIARVKEEIRLAAEMKARKKRGEPTTIPVGRPKKGRAQLMEERDNRIFEMYKGGLSGAEIARRMVPQMDRGHVNQIIRRTKLKRAKAKEEEENEQTVQLAET